MALPGVVAAGGPSSQAQSRAEVLKFWTPERMRSAKWLDVVYDPSAKEGKLVTRSQFQPSNTNDSSWNGSADNSTDEMARVSGRVYFAFGRSAYICSGSVIRDANRASYSTVLTAAHCTFDQKRQRFATQWMFIPDFDVAPTYTCADTFGLLERRLDRHPLRVHQLGASSRTPHFSTTGRSSSSVVAA